MAITLQRLSIFEFALQQHEGASLDRMNVQAFAAAIRTSIDAFERKELERSNIMKAQGEWKEEDDVDELQSWWSDFRDYVFT